MPYKVVLNLESVSIQLKVILQYFLMVLFVFYVLQNAFRNFPEFCFLVSTESCRLRLDCVTNKSNDS